MTTLITTPSLTASLNIKIKHKVDRWIELLLLPRKSGRQTVFEWNDASQVTEDDAKYWLILFISTISSFFALLGGSQYQNSLSLCHEWGSRKYINIPLKYNPSWNTNKWHQF